MAKVDGRRNNGGHKTAGRKSKAEEIKLIEKLTPMADDAYKALREGIKEGSFPFVKLFFEYYAGKPKESVDITTGNEPIGNTITKEEAAAILAAVEKSI